MFGMREHAASSAAAMNVRENMARTFVARGDAVCVRV
jgi:hypothetical protein